MHDRSDLPQQLRHVMDVIDQQNPLTVPATEWANRNNRSRLDRLEAKVSYMAEYVAYLEARIVILETRSSGS